MTAMTMYIKTLNAGRISPIQGRSWPEPGEWLTSAHARAVPLTTGRVARCVPAVYASRPDQLAHWIAPEAWVIELDGAVEGVTKVGAVRGRLVRRVEGWTPETLSAWAMWCADRAVRVHAVAALRSAGLTAAADQLEALPAIVDAVSADAADAAGAAAAAAADAADAAGAADAADAADAAGAAEMRLLSLRLAEMTGIGSVAEEAER